jgi:hypothetical protein
MVEYLSLDHVAEEGEPEVFRWREDIQEWSRNTHFRISEWFAEGGSIHVGSRRTVSLLSRMMYSPCEAANDSMH